MHANRRSKTISLCPNSGSGFSLSLSLSLSLSHIYTRARAHTHTHTHTGTRTHTHTYTYTYIYKIILYFSLIFLTFFLLHSLTRFLSFPLSFFLLASNTTNALLSGGLIIYCLYLKHAFEYPMSHFTPKCKFHSLNLTTSSDFKHN